MNEIEKRIATVWSGQPTTADVEATRIADLRAVLETTNALAEKLDVQTDIVGQLGASFHALAARVAKLEERTESVGSAAGSTGKRPVCEANEPRLSCAPLDSLVERMAEAMWVLRHRTVAWSMAEYAEKEEYRKDARAALRVAAEGLLGEITGSEWEDACARYGVNGQGAITNAVLRARLAAALEACRG